MDPQSLPVDQQSPPVDKPVSDELHPAIYAALVGAVAWFAIAIWGFARDAYTDWLLVVVSAFALIAVAIPTILSRVGHDRRASAGRKQHLFDWASGDFATWTDRCKASNAAVEVLLPLGAIALGMTAIAIVFAAERA